MKVKLSDIQNASSIKVVRDAAFESIGFITHNKPHQLTFLEEPAYLPMLLKNTNISVVITSKDIAPLLNKEVGIGISADPKKSFYEIHNHLAKGTGFYQKSFKTAIADSARIHPTAYVADHNVYIGARSQVGPNASILEYTILKEDVIIRAGSVIGNEGFQFIRSEKEIIPILHAGGVILHNRVEIQGNAVVDKALFGGFTEIGEDTKVDNLVHIAHNVRIGKRCLIVALAMIGGSVTIGNDVWIGPSAAIAPELIIGDGAFITLGSVVTQDVAPGQKVTGNFAIDHAKFIAFLKTIR